MNNTTKSITQKAIAYARGTAGRKVLNDAFGGFPSYLRVFDNFFRFYPAKPQRETARCLAIRYARFLIAPASVAFV
jgi:hypothetical protein